MNIEMYNNWVSHVWELLPLSADYCSPQRSWVITARKRRVGIECWWHLLNPWFPVGGNWVRWICLIGAHHLLFWFWAACAMLRRVFSYTSSCACTRIRWVMPPMTLICPCDCCRHSNDPCFSSSSVIEKLNCCSIGWLLPLLPSVGNDKN